MCETVRVKLCVCVCVRACAQTLVKCFLQMATACEYTDPSAGGAVVLKTSSKGVRQLFGDQG